MKKILYVIIMLILNINLFSFSLSSIEFDEILKKEEFKTKEYILKNNTDEIKKYTIQTDSKDVEIKPKNFVLSPHKEQSFIIKVLGNGKKGKNEYYMTITEKVLNKSSKQQNSIYVNKVVKIKQKYFID
ncbi:hypothetical protein [Cetobacterium somerae]